MKQSVEFNGLLINKKLDRMAGQLRFAAAVTVNRVRPLVIQDVKIDMEKTFLSFVPFTKNSVRKRRGGATKARPEARIWISPDGPKGNAPEDYLLPQIEGGPVYLTRFQRRLKRQLSGYTGEYMMPAQITPGARRSSYNGRLTASEYTRALYGIRAMDDLIARQASRSFSSEKSAKKSSGMAYRTDGKYLYVPWGLAGKNLSGPQKEKARLIRGKNEGKIPAPGIYRVRSKDLQDRFFERSTVPVVNEKFDFHQSCKDSVHKRVEGVFRKVAAEIISRG